MIKPQRQAEIVTKRIKAAEATQQFLESIETKDLCDVLILRDMLEDMQYVLENELTRRGY